MPFEFSLSSTCITFRLVGDMTPEEVMLLAKKAGELERDFAVVPDRLIDTTALTGGPVGFRDVSDFLATRKRIAFANSYKCAVVAPGSLQRGFARMFQTLNEHPQILLEIFDNLPAAEKWLLEPKA